MVKCVELTNENGDWAEVLFRQVIREDELPYKLFGDREAFLDFFLPEREKEYKKVTLVLEDASGFASGCCVAGEERAYITFVAVRKDARRQGLGTLLLRELERTLKAEAVIKWEIVFFNPMTFSWMIPSSKGADHPNAPGIDVENQAYLFFKNCGYRDYAMQNSYYLKLLDYQVPGELAYLKEKLKEEGITFDIYREGKHTGLKALMEGFQNSMWERDILGETAKKNSRPILIVSDGGKAVGFTGPLDVEPSGRGFFAGIGVDAAYRGRCIAKVLFCILCVSLKEQGAQFMTLFTGENNPARNIYEAAGFRIVKTWADMRKETE